SLAAPAWSSTRSQGSSPGSSPAGGTVDYFELSGVIDPVSAQALTRVITSSEASRSTVLIVRLDTPGGLRVSVTDLVDRVRRAKVPVVVWVAPQGARAAGAGLFVAEAAPVLVMGPGTTLGPAVPVNLDGTTDPAAAAAYLRSIISSGPRPQATVALEAVSDETAAREGIVSFRAGTLSTLLQNLDGRTVTVDGQPVKLSVADAPLRFQKLGFFDRLLHAATRPAVAYMLLLVGLFGIVFELYFPGIGAAGAMGGGALVLSLYGFSVLPTSWAALALVVVGIVAFVPDLHSGGLGVPTAFGTVALVAGSVLLFPHASPALRLPWWVIVAAVVGTLLFFISIMTAALRARAARPPAGIEGLVGSLGLARTNLVPDGEVTAAGSLWRARTLGAAIPEGTTVRVRSVAGLLLLVEGIGEEETTGEVSPDGPAEA
ncbi:MAG TPA: NfeD family protein, partial [Actinomycetota bacterium]|nr:NfeD family protein [Actinomycetota bacterium]